MMAMWPFGLLFENVDFGDQLRQPRRVTVTSLRATKRPPGKTPETAASAQMLAPHRHRLILDAVRSRGAVRVRELTQSLGVSEMTVRRDIDVLAVEGLIEKVHGGATALAEEYRPERRSAEEPGFEAKLHRQKAEKQAIAAWAAGLVKPGTAIGMTAGTTTWHMAGLLGDVADLVVVTNSLPVADALHAFRRPDLTVVLTGGLRTPSDALVGPVAVATLRSLHVDQLFMGVHGMAERSGFTTPNLVEAETNRAFVDGAQRVVVLADHTKWGVVGLSSMADLDRANTVVTDERLARSARDVLSAHVAEVVAVPVRRARS